MEAVEQYLECSTRLSSVGWLLLWTGRPGRSAWVLGRQRVWRRRRHKVRSGQASGFRVRLNGVVVYRFKGSLAAVARERPALVIPVCTYYCTVL